jgi:hypothetical protein
MKKNNKCRLFGHKWQPIFIKGRYSNIEVKFIACRCKRCDKGHDDILDSIEKQTVNEYNTYNEKYYI